MARPHSGTCRQPIDSPSAWKGEELRESSDWSYQLTPQEVDDICRAVLVAESRKKPTIDLTKADFPLKVLEPQIKMWRRELKRGRGFQVIKGIPVNEWSDHQTEIFFWCLGQHIGIPGTQNPQGDLLGHVRDTRVQADQDAGRLYKTTKNINYHCDAADVVGLLCLKKAKQGGHSRIVSSVTVYNELLKKHPHLIDRLYQPFHLDTHGEGGVKTFPIEPCRYINGELKTFYHSDYFRSAFDYPHVDNCSALDKELLDVYESIAEDQANYIDMDLEPGDIQLVSNHTVLHARTGYTDHEALQDRRHLLRLWLTLDSTLTISESMALSRARLHTLRLIVPAKILAAMGKH
ncbi:MAG: TauD/TfdA family dioxygenase [Pseudomonadales bacterium]|nr:TauD/TfdA family dioxygenase [Pseudomonadales bacterium]